MNKKLVIGYKGKAKDMSFAIKDTIKDCQKYKMNVQGNYDNGYCYVNKAINDMKN